MLLLHRLSTTSWTSLVQCSPIKTSTVTECVAEHRKKISVYLFYIIDTWKSPYVLFSWKRPLLHTIRKGLQKYSLYFYCSRYNTSFLKEKCWKKIESTHSIKHSQLLSLWNKFYSFGKHLRSSYENRQTWSEVSIFFFYFSKT